MVKFSKEAYICVVSGIWSVVVVICSLFDVLDIRSGQRENFYGVFTKVSTSMLGVVQFMISAKLLAHSRSTGLAGHGSANARSWYYSYMLVAITMTLIFTCFYVFKECGYYHTYWGFSFFDMILFFDVAIFFAFAIFHPPPPHATGKPTGRRNVDWIPREIVPERVIVGSGLAKEPTADEMQIKSTNSNVPYGRMENENDSFA